MVVVTDDVGLTLLVGATEDVGLILLVGAIDDVEATEDEVAEEPLCVLLLVGSCELVVDELDVVPLLLLDLDELVAELVKDVEEEGEELFFDFFFGDDVQPATVSARRDTKTNTEFRFMLQLYTLGFIL